MLYPSCASNMLFITLAQEPDFLGKDTPYFPHSQENALKSWGGFLFLSYRATAEADKDAPQLAGSRGACWL